MVGTVLHAVSAEHVAAASAGSFGWGVVDVVATGVLFGNTSPIGAASAPSQKYDT